MNYYVDGCSAPLREQAPKKISPQSPDNPSPRQLRSPLGPYVLIAGHLENDMADVS